MTAKGTEESTEVREGVLGIRGISVPSAHASASSAVNIPAPGFTFGRPHGTLILAVLEPTDKSVG